MLKYCKDQWHRNEKALRGFLAQDTRLNSCGYKYLVERIVQFILNINNDGDNWDFENITEIDNGDYQGTLVFVIPKDTYQPSAWEYLMTFVSYGSCTVCDTLQGIHSMDFDAFLPTEEQLKEYMTLCRDIVCHMVRPFKGWAEDERFDEVEFD